MKKTGYLLWLLLLCCLPLTAFADDEEDDRTYRVNCYLSTEKSFMEGEDAQIKIESQGMDSVTVRVYRVADPQAFLKDKKKINRVYIESEYIKRNPIEQFMRYANRFRASVRTYGYDLIADPDVRHQANTDIRTFLEPFSVPKSLYLGRLKEFELVKEFPWDLASEGWDWMHAYIPLGKLARGLYIVELFSKDTIAYTMVHVSKTTMLVKQTGNQVFVRAVDRETGSGVVADVSIYNFQNGQQVFSGQTSADGMLTAPIPKNKYDELMVYSVVKGATDAETDMAFSKLSLYPVPQFERMVYLYTQSPIYRPGDTIEIKGILRDFNDAAYTIPTGDLEAELSVIDPRGTETELGNAPINQFGSFLGTFETAEYSPTGIYTIVATIEGKRFQGEFRVEHYVKPYFKVDLTLPKKIYTPDEPVTFAIDAAYFTGNRVASGQLRYSIFRTPLRADLLESEKNIFEDPEYASRLELMDTYLANFAFDGEQWEVESNLDDYGRAGSGETTTMDKFEFSFSPAQYGADREYVYIIKAEVIDTSYAVGSASATIKVVNSSFALQAQMGKPLYTANEDVSVTVALKRHDGKPVSKQAVQYRATLEDAAATISEGSVTTDKNGLATVKFKADGKGFLRVFVSAKDDAQREVSQNVFTWLGQDGGTFVYTSGDVTVVLDKAEYQVGDTAQVLLVSPVPDADALISLERDDIFETSRRQFSGNTMLLDVPITAKFTPNVYFQAAFVFHNQLYEQTVNLKVPPTDRVLTVEITPDKTVYVPREQGTIQVKVTDQAGNPVEAELSLAVVNEALYRISPEIAPNMWLFFYSPRWNAVNMSNALATRFYGYSRSLRERFALDYYARKIWDFEDFLHANSRYAGIKDTKDQSPPTAASEERKLFKDHILWMGQVTTDAEGRCSVPITFPDNLTEWRITAVAATKDTRLGKQTASVKTERNFFVRLNMPRHLSRADKAQGFVTVENNREQARKVTLNVVFDGVTGSFKTKTISLKGHGQRTFEFPLIAENVGNATIRAEAVSGAESDILEEGLDILPITLPQTKSQVKLIESPNDGFSVEIPATAIPSTVSLKVGLAELASPFGAVVEALPFVKHYPYGCVEQTTSSFLPNLLAFSAAKKLGIELPEVFNDREKLIREGLDRLYGFRNQDYGWGWWNEHESDLFMTAYVLYALSFIYQDYPDMLNLTITKRGLEWLQNALDNGEGDQNARIFGYYVLARNELVYAYMLDSLFENPPDSPYFLALLILTGKTAGVDDEQLNQLAENLDSLAQTDGASAWWSSTDDNAWYGSPIVATSAVIRALLAVTPDSGNIARGVTYLLLHRDGNHWASTRETAEAIYALSDYAAANPQQESHPSVSVSLDAEALGTMEFSAQQYKNTLDVPAEKIQPGQTREIRFGVQDGKYVGNVALSYALDDTNVAADNQGIGVTRAYYRVKNKQEYVPLADNETIKAGETILVELDLTPTAGKSEFVAVEDAMPAGCLPVFNVNEYEFEEIRFFENMAYHEFGKRSANFFFNTLTPGKYYYLMQAVYPGEYHVLPTVAYQMYHPEVRGNSQSRTLAISK